MVDVIEPIDDEKAEIQIWPSAHFCGFDLENAVTIHPIFDPCPLNEVIARWWNGHTSSHLLICEYADMDRCLMWINVLKLFSSNSEDLCEHAKTILLKTRKPFSCRDPSDDIVSVQGANVSDRLGCFRPSIELKEKDMSEMF